MELYKANLINTDFTGADATNANFCGAYLAYMKFDNTIFKNTDLHNAKLMFADLKFIKI